MVEILVGSNAFFKDMPDFRSKDRDYLILVDEPTDFKVRKEVNLRGVDRFYYKRCTVREMVDYVLEKGDALLVGKFLVPDVAMELNVTVEDILPLEPLLGKLDEEHQYQRIIFDAIRENDSFDLTDEQRNAAYECYKNSREKEYPRTVG